MNTIWSALFLLFASAVLSFEAYALIKDKTTLSRFVWNLAKAWPPLGCAVGLVLGVLLAHFFWPCQGCPL